MINTKRALLFLPPYLVWVIVIDGLFNSASPAGSKSVRLWMMIGFVVSAVAVTGIVLWYVIRRPGGKVPEQRHHSYMALLIAVVVSGFVDDALKGVASLVIPGPPWWVLVPVYTAGYVVLWAMLICTGNRLERGAKAAERSRSTV